MNGFQLPDGTVINPDTGDILGAGEPARVGAKEVGSREVIGDVNVDKPLLAATGDKKYGIPDLFYQGSWGLNSAMFALPDAAISAVAKAFGAKDEEVPSLTRLFNRGQVAPENMVERFANTIGKGIGSGLPLTGLLGYFAAQQKLVGPLTADAGAVKRIAKDMLDYIRKDPVAAVKADIAFGGIYGGLEQSVEEFMEPGEGKDFAKAIVPMAGIMAIPSILNVANKVAQYSPTGMAVRAVRGEAGERVDFSRDDIVQQMVGEKTPKIPGLNWAIGKVAGYNERQAGERVSEILKPLNDPSRTGTADAIKVTRELEDFIRNDPRLKDLGLSDRFLLDLAQMSLDGSVLGARNELIKNISGSPLIAERARQEDLEKVFLETFQALAPKAPMPISQALRAAYADHMNTVAGSTKQIANATEEEALMFADRFKAANLDDLGAWLRSSVMAQSEGMFYKLRQEAENIGARQAVSPDGVPLPTRTMGTPLPQYSPREFEQFSRGLVAKFKLTPNDRIFVNQATPAPVQYINSLLKRFDNEVERKTANALDSIVQRYYLESFSPNSSMGNAMRSNPELLKEFAPNLVDLKSFILGRDTSASVLKKLGSDFKLPTEAQKKSMLKEAEEQARKDMSFEITRPEALNMLEASLRYRNSAIAEYNKRMDFGIKRNSAQQVLDTANALHGDVEKFVMKSFGQDPALAQWMDKYDDIFRNGYEKALPLLISRRRGTEDFLLSSERVVAEALKSADNVRTLNAIMGPDNVKYQQSLLDAMYDKAYRSNVMDQDGILDPKKYQRFLQSNRNLIEAMPDTVQRELRDELSVADKSLKRIADLRQRKEDVEDVELVNTLKKAVRPDADPQKLVVQAVEDPAVMRKLVDSLANQPGQLEALRRQVWLGVEKDLFNTQNPTFLEDFLKRNSKSLNILYDPQHLDDLRVVAEMQKRVFAGDPVTGKLSPFLSVDEKLRQTIGAGIGSVESTARAAAIRQISTFHAGVGLLTRFATRQQTNAYEAVLYRALTDAKYAHQLVNSSASSQTPKGVQQQEKLAAKVGVSLGRVLGTYAPPALKVAGIEGVQALEDETREVPVQQRVIAPPSARPQTPPPPAAPAALGQLGQSPPARSLPKMPAQPGEGGFANYARMFPNDFVSPIIQQQTPQP